VGVSEGLPVGTLDDVGLSEGFALGFVLGFAVGFAVGVGAGDVCSGVQEPLSNGFIATGNNCRHP
jgi:hypothetical protein